MDTILLIDFNNFAWRGNIKFKSISNEISYTVVFLFFRNLISIIEQFYPSKIFLCGEGGKSFRHNIYGQYKANRLFKSAETHSKSTLDNFYRQINIIWDLCQYLPVVRASANTFEADDVINTLSFNLKEEDVVIISNDSDYVQLLQKKELKNISIFDPYSNEYVDPPTYFYLAYKICAGDKADNIPRIVSHTKAVRLASDPRKLESFLSNEENRANYNLNRQLIELAVIPDEKLSILDGSSNFQIIMKKFEEMRFTSFLKNFDDFTKSFKSLK